eukprot:CAMPEP_0202884874 /NCGR_PEP_ID=MMETSP1391-20130828/41374_1 /ASSEMBLY_ACC=CAM_ASM_000867 /TAXON_ID=1034604 /ORGANISM="Chlamydomonas leiostraca, Strain SAG 11-49" /LENGTH=195 /DNA_ID=CAMNT_0049568107 /DNA_START=303 /DNA_END=887 /DNA_ORIENTATION=+
MRGATCSAYGVICQDTLLDAQLLGQDQCLGLHGAAPLVGGLHQSPLAAHVVVGAEGLVSGVVAAEVLDVSAGAGALDHVDAEGADHVGAGGVGGGASNQARHALAGAQREAHALVQVRANLSDLGRSLDLVVWHASGGVQHRVVRGDASLLVLPLVLHAHLAGPVWVGGRAEGGLEVTLGALLLGQELDAVHRLL